MTTHSHPSTVGKYIGACFLIVETDGFKYLSWHVEPGPERYMVFAYSLDTEFGPLPVAFYQTDSQIADQPLVQIQAMGHGAWLSRAKSGKISWGAEPASFIRHEKDGIITLQGYGHDEGASEEYLERYLACAERGYSLLYPTWQKQPTAVPVLKMTILKSIHSADGYPGPWPSPEELRHSPISYGGMDFADIVLLGTDLTDSNLISANFTKATLRSVAFTKAKLVKAQFQGNVLYWEGEKVQCIFNNADLREANLNRVVAYSCRFDWANMQGASLLGAKLAWADLGGANLTEANCTEADFTGAVMVHTVITKAVFRRSTLAKVDFAHATVGKNDFTEANLQHSQFQGHTFNTKGQDKMAHLTIFTRADLSWAQFDNVKAAHCEFGHAILQEASFKDADLWCANFEGANLSKADFSQAVFCNAHLENAVLSDTNFTKSDLRGAHLTGAKFDNTTFTGAIFSAFDFQKYVFWREGERRPSNFNGADLVGANFERAVASQCYFAGADLKQTRWADSKLVRADFCGANLKDADFTRADLTGANIRSVVSMDINFQGKIVFDKTILHDAVFEHSMLQAASFITADLRRTDFSRTYLFRAKFTNCVFMPEGETIPCKFHSSDLEEANLDGVQARDGIFYWSNLQRASLKGAYLVGANFAGANIMGADFTGADLTGAIFESAMLDGVNFGGCDLTGAIFLNAHAKGKHVQFDGAKLNQASFENAAFPGATFTRAKMDKTILAGADLRGCDFTGVNLSTATIANKERPVLKWLDKKYTKFKGSTINFELIGLDWSFLNLEEAKLENVPTVLSDAAWPGVPAGEKVWQLTGLHAESAVLKGMSLVGAVLRKAVLRNALLQGINLNGANLNNANLSGAALNNAQLTSASLKMADLSNADLSFAEMSNVEFWGNDSTMVGATLLATNLVGAYLVAADFSAIKGKALQGCNFDHACLANARFVGTKVSKYGEKHTSFAAACLQGADFSEAELFGANLTNAAIALEAGDLPVTIPSTGRSIMIPYGETKLAQYITDGATACPSGDYGPCDLPKLESDKAPKKWPSV